MHHWQMQEAKARLSEVVRQAEQAGPQDITLHGRSVAVMVSRAEFDRLAGTGESLVDFMRRSPLYGLEDVDFPRDPSLTCEVAV
jgi:prevent-host-death family protein